MAPKQTWGEAPFNVTLPDDNSFTLLAKGRDRWALECLIDAGEKGCTPIDHPGPRWSGYVFNLRTMGVAIETLTEPHSGPFSGHHARYVLRCNVQRLARETAA